jgi:phosphatidyl-myo-inositol dimannoside synthase
VRVKLNVLALVTDAFGASGGIAQYNRDFLRVLSGFGIIGSVMVLSRNMPSASSEPLPRIELDHPRPRKMIFSAMSLVRSFRQPVHIVYCGHLFMAPLAALIARLRHAILVVQTHGVEAWHRPSLFVRLAAEKADFILSVSRYTRSAVLGWAMIDPERVLVVPNTVQEIYGPGDGQSLRQRLGLVGKRVLLTVGRMSSQERYKGHERVINAIPGLVGKGHDVVYVIVGDGDDRFRLERVVRHARLHDRVLFLGSVERDILVDIYRMADVFVMPSTGEGFGIAFLEAMASGTPAVGLSVAGALDALLGNALGHAVDEEELTPALLGILEDATADSAQAADRVRQRFGYSCFAHNLQSVLYRFCEARE